MDTRKLAEDLDVIRASLTNMKAYVADTAHYKVFKQHILEIEKEKMRAEREDQTIKKSVEGGLLLVLRLVNEDVKELIPRFKEPWKESMTHLTNHIELVQSQVKEEHARTR